MTERLQVTAAFEQRNFIGGGLDGLIIEFHDIFRLEQGGRTEAPISEFISPIPTHGVEAYRKGRQ